MTFVLNRLTLMPNKRKITLFIPSFSDILMGSSLELVIFMCIVVTNFKTPFRTLNNLLNNFYTGNH